MIGKLYTCQLEIGMIVSPSILGIPAIAKILQCDRRQSEPNYFVCLQDVAGNEYEFYSKPDCEWTAIDDDAFQLLATKH